MTRLELIRVFERCEYNIKKINLESYIPSSEIYCEADGIEKLGDSIDLFFKKMKNNMRDMQDKAKIRRKYQLRAKQALQNQKRNLANINNDKPELYPDIAEYAKVANYGIVKMTDAAIRFNKTKYERSRDLGDAFVDLYKYLNSLASELTKAMKPVRLMYPSDYADSIMELKKNGIDIIELGIRFDKLMDTIKRDAVTVANNTALDISFREKYAQAVKDVATDISKTQLTMVKDISTLIEFKGIDPEK